MKLNTILKILVLVSVAACSNNPPPKPAERHFIHEVKYQGETLGNISRWYTNKESNWRAILSYNPGLNPKNLRKGDIVQIPFSMVKRTDDFPRPSVAKTIPKGASVDSGSIATTDSASTSDSAPAEEVSPQEINEVAAAINENNSAPSTEPSVDTSVSNTEISPTDAQPSAQMDEPIQGDVANNETSPDATTDGSPSVGMKILNKLLKPDEKKIN